MGDVADMMIDGTLCSTCGVLLDGGSPDYPRQCRDCRKRSGAKEKKSQKSQLNEAEYRKAVTAEAEGLKRNIAVRQKRLDEINRILGTPTETETDLDALQSASSDLHDALNPGPKCLQEPDETHLLVKRAKESIDALIERMNRGE